MSRGKSICSVLKTIRKQVADANEIEYEPRECHHQGDSVVALVLHARPR